MLPFLAKKSQVGSVAATARPVGDADAGPDSDLKECMVDFLSAVDRKSPEDMLRAFKAAFSICEMQPHEEAGEPEAAE